MPTIITQLQETVPSLRPQLEAVQQAATLQNMILAAWKLGFAIALLIVQETLNERGKAPTEAQHCPKCQARLHSKGLHSRQLTTILGLLCWKRRLLRCPHQGQIGQIAPLDNELGITAHQETSTELKAMSCALAVFVPFGTAAVLLERITGVVT
jgi:hypothetical protein